MAPNNSPPSFRSLQTLVASRSFERDLKVSDTLTFPEFERAAVVGGGQGSGRFVKQVNVMQIPTAKFTKPDELVLAAEAAVTRDRIDQARLVITLAEAGISALAVRRSNSRSIFDGGAIKEADRIGLPLIELPSSVHLTELQSKILEHIIMQRAVQLRVASETLDSLARHATSDRALYHLVEDIARLIGAPVSAFDAHGTMVATTSRPDDAILSFVDAWLAQQRNDPVELGTTHILWPVLAGMRRLGCLTVGVGRIQDGLTLAALEHGATIAAMQMLHAMEAAETDTRLKSRFLRELLSGVLDPRSARRRASALGWNIHGSYFAMVVRPPVIGRTALTERLAEMAVGALLTEQGGSTVALIPERTGISLDTIPSRLVSQLPGIYVGTSREHVGLESIPLAVHEGRAALMAAEQFSRLTRIRNFSSLGPLLLLKEISKEDLREFEAEILAPVDALEPDYRTALLQTLELLIATNLNIAETARRGEWHYNTVRHRVMRLSELLGPFMGDGATLDSISVALLLRHELGDQRRAERANPLFTARG